MTFLTRCLVLGGLAALTLTACPEPRHATRPPQGIRLTCSRPEAAVYVDELLVGRCDQLKRAWIGMAPGAHRLTVKAPGFFARHLDLNIRKGDMQQITATLQPELE